MYFTGSERSYFALYRIWRSPRRPSMTVMVAVVAFNRHSRTPASSDIGRPIFSLRADSPSRHDFSVASAFASPRRSEEHTSELQSRLHLVCRLLLEKKKTIRTEPVPVSGD